MSERPHSPAPRDRLAAHLIWEGVLVVIVIALLVVLLATGPEGRSGDMLAGLISRTGYYGLVAAGFALSLRTGTPNLAVGALAIATGSIGAHLARDAQWPPIAAMAVAVILVTIGGAVIGLLTGALSVPAWAVTFGAAFVILGLVLATAGPGVVPLRAAPPPGVLWFVLFLLVSVGGALLWRLPAVREALSAARTSGEPGRWAGLRAGLGALVGITASSLLAAIGGVGFTTTLAASSPAAGDTLTLAAVAAVLIGGASIFGRRAGIAGTVLGVLVVQLAQTILTLLGVEAAVATLVNGVLLIIGLGVSRLLESVSTGLESPAAPPLSSPLPRDMPPPRTP